MLEWSRSKISRTGSWLKHLNKMFQQIGGFEVNDGTSVGLDGAMPAETAEGQDASIYTASSRLEEARGVISMGLSMAKYSTAYTNDRIECNNKESLSNSKNSINV